MDFEKLRLTGFKSFVEPTDFEIRPGLTGIVGPNGCGKSNLLEALRWVMGATSAKALRAGGMEDVIFAGSGSDGRPGRPARSWAEVTLFLDNENRTAPAEYNEHPAIEVTRRITKKAEGSSSTYRINGKEVRAKDVQLLFADASTGANSPALVRQGQVSDLINAKPENRRKFLEEAAGVTGLYTRRHEAELRLKAAATNLERLEDVTAELESQKGLLSRQARQATRYRGIADKLKKAEALLAYARWQDAQAAVAHADEALNEAVRDLETAASAAASAHAEREKLHEQIEPLRQKEAEAAAALHRLTVEQENFEKERERAQDDIKRLEETRDRLERELAREQDLGHDAGQALEALDREEEQLRHRHEAEARRLEEANAEVEAAQAVLTQAEAEAERLQTAFAEAQAEQRALTAAHQRAEQAQRQRQAELDRAQQELDAFTAQAGASEAIEALRAECARLQTVLTETTGAYEAALAARDRAEQAVETAQAPRDEAMALVNTLQAEVDTLKRILAQSEPEGRAILEDITVAEGFEGALAAALDEGLAASDDPTANQYWSPLGAEHIDHPLPDRVLPLAEKVTAPAVLARRLRSIGIVEASEGDRLAAALQPGQRLVSREGDVWRWDGFVAKAGAQTAAAQRLEQKRRLTESEAALAAAFTCRDEAEQSLAAHKSASAEARTLAAAARVRMEETQKALTTAEREVSRLDAEEQKRASKGEALADKLADATTRVETAQTECREAALALENQPDLSALEAELGQARTARDQARSANGRARAQRADLKRDADARQSRLSQIAEQRQSWQKRRGTASERIAQVHQHQEETKVALESALRVPDTLEARRESLYEAVSAAESRRRIAADALAEVQSTLAETERAARTADEAASLAREVKARVTAEREASHTRLADTLARAREVHDAAPKELAVIAEHDAEAPLPDHDALEAQIDKLKRDREALGGVNLCADQEMQEVEARLEEIARETEDCEAAIAKLRGAIGSLNRDGRQRLLDAFDRVNANFQDLFKQLFGGGEAELRLVDSDDPLEAGLEIFASPPGKRLASMSLMSGGEQALTATALIFAVFRSNPAPVCVLDEVDAPLDDANTDRFCAMLAKMAEDTNTRFIAITHHPLTMSRMDRLYGVTMIERGVSQLVSVDLAEAEKMAA